MWLGTQGPYFNRNLGTRVPDFIWKWGPGVPIFTWHRVRFSIWRTLFKLRIASPRSKFVTHAQIGFIPIGFKALLAGKIPLIAMAFNRVRKLSVFSRKVLLLLLLLAPRQDPLYFSVQSGQSLIPDPGVKLSMSQPSSHGFLPGPEAVLSLVYRQALTDTFRDLLRYLILTLMLMWILKIVCIR